MLEDSERAVDYANTATVLVACYTAFAADKDVDALKQRIRKELDTMVWEEVLDALEFELEQ